MGSLSDTEQRKLAYFHALGKAMTEGNQNAYESKYKSSHNVRANEIWSDPIATAVTYTAAVAESVTNSAVTLHTMVTLTMVPGSNGQAYYFNSGGTFVRPWISPVDVPNPVTNAPSNGYQLRLFKGDNTEISLTNGAWDVDYYVGIIHFSSLFTPSILGWGAIKATLFQYTGNYGGGGSVDAFTTAVFNSGTSQIIFNSGLSSETIVDLGVFSSGITSLSTAVSTEVSIRTSETSSLSTSLTLSNSGISSLSGVISTEILTRESSDISLSISISTGLSTESSTRTSVDSSLSTAILNAGSGTGVTSLSTALSIEESTRLSVDMVLSQAIADIVSGMTSSGGTLATSNINMTTNTTISDGDLACGIGISSLPFPDSYVSVYVNGIQVNVGNGVKTEDCYFSNDGGFTAKLWTNIGVGNQLYWNGSVIGYQLNSTTDKISFIYITI